MKTLRILILALASLASPAWAEEPMPAADESAPAIPETDSEPMVEPGVSTSDSSRPTMDHLELDPTAITGNRELPKVMVIVPWKKAELGDLTGKPANSLLNEVLEPIDREAFRRELRYFEALEAKPET
jgi:hypothetical protein